MTTQTTILVVGNDTNNEVFLTEAFDEIGFREKVKMFKNGTQILQFLDKPDDPDQFPAFILLDVNMPGMNGLETFSALKNHPLYRIFPSLCFPESITREIREQCLIRGAQSFVIKPHFFEANIPQYLYQLLRFENNALAGEIVLN